MESQDNEKSKEEELSILSVSRISIESETVSGDNHSMIIVDSVLVRNSMFTTLNSISAGWVVKTLKPVAKYWKAISFAYGPGWVWQEITEAEALGLFSPSENKTFTIKASYADSVLANPHSPLSYQWQYSDDLGNTWEDLQDGDLTVSGSKLSRLNLTWLYLGQFPNRVYRCRLISTGTNSTITSSVFNLELSIISGVSIESETVSGDNHSMIIVDSVLVRNSMFTTLNSISAGWVVKTLKPVAKYWKAISFAYGSGWVWQDINEAEALSLFNPSENRTFTINANEKNSTTYQWQYSDDLGNTWQDLSDGDMYVHGSKTNTLNLTWLYLGQFTNRTYRCYISDENKVVTSSIFNGEKSFSVIVIKSSSSYGGRPSNNSFISVDSVLARNSLFRTWNSIGVGEIVRTLNPTIKYWKAVSFAPDANLWAWIEVTESEVENLSISSENIVYSIDAISSRGPITYQWQYSDDFEKTWTDLLDLELLVAGSNSSNLTLTHLYLQQFPRNSYRCCLSAIGAKSVISNVFKNKHSRQIKILYESSSVKDSNVRDTIYSVVAEATPPENIYHQWQYSDDDGKSWNNLDDKKDSHVGAKYFELRISYFFQNSNPYRLYRDLISAPKAQTIQSSVFGNRRPVIFINSIESQEEFDKVIYLVNASVTQNKKLNYRWQYSNDFGATWINLNDSDVVSGSTSKNLSLSYYYLKKFSHRKHRVELSAVGAEKLSSGILSIGSDSFSSVNIIAKKSFGGAQGENLIYSVIVSSPLTVNYSWQYSDDGGLSWEDLSDGDMFVHGSKTNTLNLTWLYLLDNPNRQHRVEVYSEPQTNEWILSERVSKYADFINPMGGVHMMYEPEGYGIAIVTDLKITSNYNYKFNSEGLARHPVTVFLPSGSINVSGGITSGTNELFFYYKIITPVESLLILNLRGTCASDVKCYYSKSTFLVGQAQFRIKYLYNSSTGPLVLQGSCFPRFINVFIEGSSNFKVTYNFRSDGFSRSEIFNYYHSSKVYFTVSGNSYCFNVPRKKFIKKHNSYVILGLFSFLQYKYIRCHLPEGELKIAGNSYSSVKYYARRGQIISGSFEVIPKYKYDVPIWSVLRLTTSSGRRLVSAGTPPLIFLSLGTERAGISLSGNATIYFGIIIIEGSALVKGNYNFTSDGSTGLEVPNLMSFYESTLVLKIPTSTSEAKFQINHFVGLSGIIIEGTSNSSYEYIRRTSTFLIGSSLAKATYVHVNNGDWPIFLSGNILITNVAYRYSPIQSYIYFTSSSLFIFRLSHKIDLQVNIESHSRQVVILSFVSSNVSLEILESNTVCNLFLFYDPSQQQILITNSNLMDYAQQVGKSLLFDVTGSDQGQNIWGTDLYTLDSDLNLVSVHSGLFQVGEKGRIYAKLSNPNPPYYGSLRNGILSKNWFLESFPSYSVEKVSPYLYGSYYAQRSHFASGGLQLSSNALFQIILSRNSIVSLSLNNQNINYLVAIKYASEGNVLEMESQTFSVIRLAYDPSLIVPLTTSSNLMNFINNIGQSYLFNAEASDQGSSIWGTDVYTLDSNLNLVAVHSGLFINGEQGRLYAEILPPQAPYVGTTRNGVASNDWNFNSYPSYKITKVSPYIHGGYSNYNSFEGSGIINIFGSFRSVLILMFSSNVTLEIKPTHAENNFPNKLYYNSTFEISLASGFQILLYSPLILKIDGESKSNIYFKHSSEYNFIVSGSANSNRNKFEILPILSLSLGSNEICFVPKMDPDYSISSSWSLGGTGDYDSVSECNFEINFDSKYKLDNGELHWYRVLCCCGGNEKIKLSDCSIGSLSSQNQKLYDSTGTKENYFASLQKVMSLAEEPIDEGIEVYSEPTCHKIYQGTYPRCTPGHQSILSAVIARNMAEVCLALKNPKLGPPIDKFKLLSIRRNVNPVCADDFFTFEEEDFCNCPECQDFCIDLDFAKEIETPCNNLIKVKTFVFRVLYHESNLSLSLSGSANITYYWVTGSGTISVGSSQHPILVSNYWNYSGILNLEINSLLVGLYDKLLATEPNADLLVNQEDYFIGISNLEKKESNITINRLFRQSEGYFDIFGSSNFASPRWKYNCNLILFLQSNFNCLPVISYERPLTCSYIDFGAKFSYYLYNKHEINSIASLQISGSVEFLSSGYLFDLGLDRGISIQGLNSDIVSQYRSYKSLVSFSLSSSFNKFGACLNTNGLIEVAGSSECVKYNTYKATGGVEIEGEVSEVVSPIHNYRPSGDFSIDLDSLIDTNFTNFGLLVSEANFKSFISNVSLDYFSTKQSTLSASQDYIEVCGRRTRDINLDLQHSINSSTVFSKFLKRNNLEFDKNITMRYSKNNNGWSYKNNILGNSSSDGEKENWNFIFDLSCKEDRVGNSNMKFSFFVKQINSNFSLMTAMTVDLSLDDIFSNENVFFRILLNPAANLVFVNGKLSKSFAYSDKLGLFKNFIKSTKVDCSKARSKNLGQGRRDGFKDCNIVGPFPEFRVNWTRDIKITNFINIQ